MPTADEWAWIAGLFEGEGHIGISGNKVTLRVQMNDQDVLERLDSYCPSFSGISACDWRGRSTSYRWTLCKKEPCQEFLASVLPWMGKRRASRIQEALEALSRNRGITRDGPADRPPRNLNGKANPEYDRWRYRFLKAKRTSDHGRDE